MAAKIWSNKAKRQLFIWLPKIKVNGKLVGHYTREWTGKPPHLTVKEWSKAHEILFNKMIANNVFTTPPKSSRSIDFFVQHCISPQNNSGFRQMRSTARFAAYYAGFMEMTDIVYLEDSAIAKHGVQNIV